MPEIDFNAVVALICKEDPRYDRKAYAFVREGLDHAVKELRKTDNERARKSQHVTGVELLQGLRVFCLEQFGPLANTVLAEWGIQRCEDFGEIVFNLIDYKILSKTETDRREDFASIYTFEEAFVAPFLPKNRPPVKNPQRQA